MLPMCTELWQCPSPAICTAVLASSLCARAASGHASRAALYPLKSYLVSILNRADFLYRPSGHCFWVSRDASVEIRTVFYFFLGFNMVSRMKPESGAV